MTPVKVLNLQRSENRRNSFAAYNKFLNYDFYPAVDGTKVAESILSDPSLFSHGLKYTKGAYGCALSHLQIWDLAIKEDTVYTVAEDDAIFREDFAETSEAVISMLPKDWDIMVWGWNFDSILSLNQMPGISPAVMVFNQDQLRSSVSNFQKLKSVCFPLRLDKCFGTIGYSISPKGAKKFKQLCLPLAPFDLYFPLLNKALPNNGIDIVMNKIYSLTDSYVSFSPLIVTKNEIELSTVQPNQSTP